MRGQREGGAGVQRGERGHEDTTEMCRRAGGGESDAGVHLKGGLFLASRCGVRILLEGSRVHAERGHKGLSLLPFSVVASNF